MSEKILPRPCDGELFDDWTVETFLDKVSEEYCELRMAYRDWVKDQSSKKKKRIQFFKPTN